MTRKKRDCGSRGIEKAIIRVFCAGESEQAYTEYLKKKFSDVGSDTISKRTRTV